MMDAPATRPRKRAAARTSARPAVEKTKVTLVLDSDAAKRLAVHAAIVGEERSSLVSQLIREHLRRFRVQDLDRSDRVDSAEGATVEVSDAA
jgi:hypothetical protein